MDTYEILLEKQKELEAQIEAARKREMVEALAQVRELVEKYQMQPDDIFNKSKGRVTRKVPPKYRDPVSGKTWSGRGKPPRWIEGQDRERFLIR